MEFGTDGLRGKSYEFSSEGLRRIGYELAKTGFLGKIVIGMDTRESSGKLKEDLIYGINFFGSVVIDLDIVTTPVVSYFSSMIADAKYGVMITASHNPYYDNGIKIFEDGVKISKDLEDKLIYVYNDTNLKLPEKKPNIKTEYMDSENYLKYIRTGFNFENFDNNKIVIDCANGSAYNLVQRLFTKGNFEFVSNNPNGRNINFLCGTEYRENITKEVLKRNAYMGISFDGDCDRICFCDERGKHVDGDHLIAFIASDMIRKGELENNTLVVTEYSNLALDDYIKSLGGKVIRVPNGDKNVFAKMNEIKSNFGAEKLGHMIYNRDFGTGDGLKISKEVLSRLDYSRPISEQMRPFCMNSQVVLNVAVKNKIPFEDISGFNLIYGEIKQRLEGSGRIFVRYSGTENVCRIMVESKDDLHLNKMAEEISKKFIDMDEL